MYKEDQDAVDCRTCRDVKTGFFCARDGKTGCAGVVRKRMEEGGDRGKTE